MSDDSMKRFNLIGLALCLSVWAVVAVAHRIQGAKDSAFAHGVDVGRGQNNEAWQNTLTEWGCGAYLADTGEWAVIAGATCVPVLEGDDGD